MPSPENKTDGGSAQKKTYDNQAQSIRRVTVKQIQDGLETSSGGTVYIDGKELSNVRRKDHFLLLFLVADRIPHVLPQFTTTRMQVAVVGKIVDVRDENVSFNFVLDDGTGRITVKMFVSGDTDELERQRLAELRPGIYVRAFGHFNSGAETHLQAFTARPVTDHNEVAYHLSQVIFQHLHLSKGGADVGGPPGGPGKIEGAPGGGGGAAPIVFAVDGNMTPIQQEVLAIFKAPDAAAIEAGLTVNDVVARSGNRFTGPMVQSAVTFLVDEGHLYSTIDDAHWKSCD